MSKFIVGMFIGLALACGGLYEFGRRTGNCFERCGEGTTCTAGHCVPTPPAVAAAPTPPPDKRRKRRRGSSATNAATTPSADGDPLAPAAPELTLQPGDENPVTQGDALGRAEKLDLTGGGPDAKELTDDEIERTFEPARTAISNCISKAVGDWPLDSAKVELGFRIEGTGRVDKMRLTAPSLLQRQGLYKCARPIVTGLHFRASGAANVVTFPFQLQ